MTDPLEFHITCPHCSYSNIATAPTSKYKEAVYQPCNENDGKQDHNMKGQIKCASCHNRFEFYWCAGHPANQNDTNLKLPNNRS